MTARLTVALLFGGRSGEHEVSLRSAASVARGLAARHDVACVLIDKQGRWLLQDGTEPRPSGGEPVFLAAVPEDAGRLRRLRDGREIARADVFFPVLHGSYGEDGTVQGLLELASVPYAGSGVAASAVAMDKAISKALFERAGLAQVPYRVLPRRDAEAEARLVAELGLPLFVKPANLGSSVGISKVKTPEALAPALAEAFRYDRKVVVERGLEVREIEVAALGNDEPEASVPGEVVPDREFYDYDSKYAADSRTGLLIPAPLDAAAASEARRLALAAYQALGASGYSRVDLFLEKATGRLLVNEVNTIPGFTSISMYPKLWEASGLPYPDLLARIVALALERQLQRAALVTDYAG
jgi:D-alanine-D-alanine ligase